MINALLLLPVFAILLWLYRRLLPSGAWKPRDTVLVIALVLLTLTWIGLVERVNFEDAGPLWPRIVSMVGGYAILVAGFGAGLWWRRRQSRSL